MNLVVPVPAVPNARRLRTLTELDYARLTRLLSRDPDVHHEALADALDQSSLVPAAEVARDVVTMYTRVRVDNLTHGTSHDYTICYPSDAEPTEGFVSVLSPVGSALLGARVGERATATRPDGGNTELLVREILFQPEATGDYTT